MTDLRFDGRVAVVTGGGRGLGRAYALLLASRGAKVVVNDVGVGLTGEVTAEGPADELVREIKAAGGEAVASLDTVATPAGGKAIIDTAMDTYGRIDIVIHNAGIIRRGLLSELSYEDFELALDVHLRGGFHVVREAFPHMIAQKYGRFVMTASVNGLYGKSNNGNYAVAKSGLIGLSHTAAIEGAEYNIKSNVIVPAAVTRMSEGIDTSAFPPMDPDLVAPVVGWLSHESCCVTGEIYASAAGRIARAFLAESRGVYQPSWNMEQIAAQIDAIRDEANPVIFAPAPDGQLDHLLYSFKMARE
jgi:NAD(P)-dependent dehydrogenase (short-subunit alcohol dehydrogenase family)